MNNKRLYWPTARWKHAMPEDYGVNIKLVEKAFKYIKEEFPYYKSIHIVRSGFLVFERSNPDPYEDIDSVFIRKLGALLCMAIKAPKGTFKENIGDSWNIRTATHSIISLLIGIAVKEKFIAGLDKRICDYFPELFDGGTDQIKMNITIKQLLMMQSGFKSIEKGMTAFKLLFANSNLLKAIIKMPLINKPDEGFIYSSANAHLLSAILTKATNMSAYEFAKKYLFEHLGIKNVSWEADKQGYSFGGGNLFMTTQDMSKIGYLVLNAGLWDGKQIVSKEWIDEIFVKCKESLDGSNPNYGYLWYINEYWDTIREKNFTVYSATGKGGQRIYIVPELDVVISVISRTNITKNNTNILSKALGNFIIPAMKDI
jgi:CubicO group peptidase (beta-lactamase class C family)